MSRYIDAIDRGRLIRDILDKYGDTGGTEDANKIYRMILNQPTADVVEVVRCKDCEHGQSYNMFGSRYCLKHNDVAVKDNDFCSYGERADNEVMDNDYLRIPRSWKINNGESVTVDRP